MKHKSILIAICLPFFLSSCTNDSTDDLIDTTPISGLVTYNKNVKAIIDANCISCHGVTPTNGAPMSLVTYSQVKEAIINRGLVDRISRQNGESGLMPQGGSKLPQITIDVVTKWQTDGLQE